MPPDSQSFQPQPDPDVMIVDDYVNVASSPIETATDMMEISNDIGPPSRTNDQPSTSSMNNTTKMLKFNVQYSDRIVTVDLPETSTICMFSFFSNLIYY